MTNDEQRLEISKSILNTYISNGEIPFNDSENVNINRTVKISVKIADALIEELTKTRNIEQIDESANMYSFGNTEVDRIMNLPYDDTTNLFQELQYSGIKYDKQIKLDYYRYLSTLFLNVLLNRLNIYLDIKKAEDRACSARQGIGTIIEDIRKNS